MNEVDITIVDNTGKTDVLLEAVASTGIVVAEQAAMLTNLAYSNAVTSRDIGGKAQLANQDAQNKLRISILANAVNRVQDNHALQARSAVDVLTNNELAQAIADLKATLAAFSGKKPGR